MLQLKFSKNLADGLYNICGNNLDFIPSDITASPSLTSEYYAVIQLEFLVRIVGPGFQISGRRF
jgi:hypothetical protein